MTKMQAETLKPVAKAPMFKKLAGYRSFDGVTREIRQLIGSGLLVAGDRLPAERELAAQLGVGRSTVRESLRGLEYAGLVTLKKGVAGGAFIRSPGSAAFADTLGDLYRLGALTGEHLTEARILLGCEVARLACLRRDEHDLDAIEANIKETHAAIDRGDLRTKMEGSIEFHRLLADATKNPALIIMTDALAAIMREFMQALGPKPNAFAQEAQVRLLEHLRARDEAAMVQEMSAYLHQTQKRYLEKTPD